jgi:hypothetical protein
VEPAAARNSGSGKTRRSRQAIRRRSRPSRSASAATRPGITAAFPSQGMASRSRRTTPDWRGRDSVAKAFPFVLSCDRKPAGTESEEPLKMVSENLTANFPVK